MNLPNPSTVAMGMDTKLSDSQRKIERVCNEIQRILLDKNAQYGNSALEPMRIFSKASAEEQLLVRLDDKLSRIAKGDMALESEDVVLDLIGYLILLKVARHES